MIRVESVNMYVTFSFLMDKNIFNNVILQYKLVTAQATVRVSTQIEQII